MCLFAKFVIFGLILLTENSDLFITHAGLSCMGVMHVESKSFGKK